MASVQQLTDALNALNDTAAKVVAANGNKIDPTALDPVLGGIQQVNTTLQSILPPQ